MNKHQTSDRTGCRSIAVSDTNNYHDFLYLAACLTVAMAVVTVATTAALAPTITPKNIYKKK
jgi:hypothetical protein